MEKKQAGKRATQRAARVLRSQTKARKRTNELFADCTSSDEDDAGQDFNGFNVSNLFTRAKESDEAKAKEKSDEADDITTGRAYLDKTLFPAIYTPKTLPSVRRVSAVRSPTLLGSTRRLRVE